MHSIRKQLPTKFVVSLQTLASNCGWLMPDTSACTNVEGDLRKDDRQIEEDCLLARYPY